MNYYNGEKYPDPTAFEALSIIEKEERKIKKIKRGEWNMKMVYISSPFRGDIETNINRANRYCRFAAKNGVVPIAPHTFLTQFLDDNIPEEREAGLYLGLQFLKRCLELWAFGNKITDGMKKEIDFAKRHGITIRYFNDRCEEVGSDDCNS